MIPATIAAAASVSDAINLKSGRLRGIQMPAAWTAAPLSFLVSQDGTNFFVLTNEMGAEVSFIVAASKWVAIRTEALGAFAGFTWVKLQSGTSAAPVVQAAERIVNLWIE